MYWDILIEQSHLPFVENTTISSWTIYLSRTLTCRCFQVSLIILVQNRDPPHIVGRSSNKNKWMPLTTFSSISSQSLSLIFYSFFDFPNIIFAKTCCIKIFFYPSLPKGEVVFPIELLNAVLDSRILFCIITANPRK